MTLHGSICVRQALAAACRPVDFCGAACRPIDFVAAGITGVLSHHRSGFDAYHVVNPHWDDGVSLDAIVGWVDEDRGGLRRIQDYSQWCVAPPSPALFAIMSEHKAPVMHCPG